jgi:hypothetical protein
LITDSTFFGLLGVRNVRAIDHSTYEGADIILDLNEPLPEPQESSVEFLFGGSVLDNIFDPATYIKNLARLLRPGGRLIDQNLASFHHHAYLLASPAWFFDYFVLNRFSDCKIYLLQVGAVWHLYGLEVDPAEDFIGDMGSAPLSEPFGIVVVAEKGRDSSWNIVPSQDQYRSADQWSRYRSQLIAMRASTRPYWKFSRPNADDLARVPIRRSKSFRYLGVFAGLAPDEMLDEGVGLNLPEPSRKGIQVVEASYGLNTLSQPFRRPSIIPVCRGNVTEKIVALVTGLDGGEWVIDAGYLGDPAPEMPKDLSVTYYHADDPMLRVRTAHVPAEAHGRKLILPSLNARI